MKLGNVLAEAVQDLENFRDPAPRLTAEVLLAHGLGLDRPQIYSQRERRLSSNELQEVRELVRRRLTGEPLQYITGVQEFYGRLFRVTPSVLIPRPETEFVVETVLDLNERTAPRIVDVGTGSGCIAATLALEIAGSRITATDISPDALEVARDNARRLGAPVRLAAMDRLAGLTGRFDFIVSNPPYVRADEYAGLQREVRDHEPRVALVPDDGPANFYRHLVTEAAERLVERGVLVLEIGYSMESEARRLFGDDWALLPTRTDLQGIPRVIAAVYAP